MTIRNLALIGSALALVAFSGGCATAIRGPRQSMKFVTDPPGAVVDVVSEGTPRGTSYTTPAEIRLKRNQKHDITISKTGYQAITFALVAQWDGASIPGVILPGGSVSVATDRASGADLAFFPLPTIKLTPSASPSTQPVQMYEHRGQIYGRAEYDQIIAKELQEKQNWVAP